MDAGCALRRLLLGCAAPRLGPHIERVAWWGGKSGGGGRGLVPRPLCERGGGRGQEGGGWSTEGGEGAKQAAAEVLFRFH